jgi:hypothetical protein
MNINYVVLHTFAAQYHFDHGIRVGPGRGSAAGCAVAYTLRITDLDPIRYDLLFERFLNPSRISMPDIDMDFDSRYRDEMIRYAAENGYEKVAWTKGETQAERYDLSKQVKQINVTKESNGTFTLDAVTNDGRPMTLGEAVKPEAMADIIGKDLAEKIAAQEEDHKTYTGVDLKVGGEGMKGFYDKILPATVNKLVKKYGAKVEDGKLGTPRGEVGLHIEEVQNDLGFPTVFVWSQSS